MRPKRDRFSSLLAGRTGAGDPNSGRFHFDSQPLKPYPVAGPGRATQPHVGDAPCTLALRSVRQVIATGEGVA